MISSANEVWLLVFGVGEVTLVGGNATWLRLGLQRANCIYVFAASAGPPASTLVATSRISLPSAALQ